MPLLIPGLNEADAKTFSKRLLKSLKQRGDIPSLTQLQTLVAQAIGHADWHAAQTFWGKPTPATPAPQEKAMPAGGTQAKAEELQDLRQSFDELLENAKQGSRGSFFDLDPCVQALLHLAAGANLKVEEALLDRAYVILRVGRDQISRVGREQALDPQEMWRLERLVRRAEVGLVSFFLPGQPVPVLPPLRPGEEDEPVVFEAPLSDAEQEELDRRHEELMAKEMQALDEEARAEFLPVFEDALPKAMAHMETLKTGSGKPWNKAWDLLFNELVRLQELNHYGAGERLGAAMQLLRQERKDPKEVQERIARIENHLLRARLMLMAFCVPNEPRDSFPTDEEELARGAVCRGDWKVLEKAMLQAKTFHHPFKGRNYENTAAVAGLCAWWNTHAPDWAQGARCFRVGVLSGGQVSYLGQREQPSSFPEDFARGACYALFRSPRGFNYVVHFLKGKADNRVTPFGTQVFQANGVPAWQVDSKEVNESFHSIEGLRELARDFETRFAD